jgi:Streptomycin adenylyltransferase
MLTSSRARGDETVDVDELSDYDVILAVSDTPASRSGRPHNGLAATTYRAHIPEPPSEAEFQARCEEFWWSTTYVAKGLRRGEVFFTKFALDHDAKFDALRRLLEWRIELDHGWSLSPGAYGRGSSGAYPASCGPSSRAPTSERASRRTGMRSSGQSSCSGESPSKWPRRSATSTGSGWMTGSAPSSAR